MVKQNKKYRPLPTIDLIEGLMLMAKIIKVGTFNVKAPKISDEMYMEIVKAEVMRE